MVHRRPVYIYLLNVPSFSSRYFNKIKRTSPLGRLLALLLEILSAENAVYDLNLFKKIVSDLPTKKTKNENEKKTKTTANRSPYLHLLSLIPSFIGKFNNDCEKQYMHIVYTISIAHKDIE